MFTFLTLKTRIDEEGIHVKMFPFHLSYVTYKWEEINKVKATEYSPIIDYGGWGIRISSNGKAFNIKGDKGIKIETTKGDNRMIGTQKMEEAAKIIAHYKSSS